MAVRRTSTNERERHERHRTAAPRGAERDARRSSQWETRMQPGGAPVRRPPERSGPTGVGMDAEAFDQFYEASFARLVGQVYALVGNRDEAQECVQEAFVRAWSHRRRLDSAQAPEAWVRTTA